MKEYIVQSVRAHGLKAKILKSVLKKTSLQLGIPHEGIFCHRIVGEHELMILKKCLEENFIVKNTP